MVCLTLFELVLFDCRNASQILVAVAVRPTSTFKTRYVEGTGLLVHVLSNRLSTFTARVPRMRRLNPPADSPVMFDGRVSYGLGAPPACSHGAARSVGPCWSSQLIYTSRPFKMIVSPVHSSRARDGLLRAIFTGKDGTLVRPPSTRRTYS